MVDSESSSLQLKVVGKGQLYCTMMDDIIFNLGRWLSLIG